MMRQRFDSALTFAEFLEQAQANAALWRDAYRLARVPEEAVARLAAIPGSWQLLVMVEDWCGDAVNSVPLLARLAELAPNVELRVIGREDNANIMDAHLTNGSRSIPVVMVLDEHHVERAWWGPRPSALQRWVIDEGLVLEKVERYRRIRTWYARDRGRTIVDEVIDAVARAARDVSASTAA
jgi:hypothetical protein